MTEWSRDLVRLSQMYMLSAVCQRQLSFLLLELHVLLSSVTYLLIYTDMPISRWQQAATAARGQSIHHELGVLSTRQS